MRKGSLNLARGGGGGGRKDHALLKDSEKADEPVLEFCG